MRFYLALVAALFLSGVASVYAQNGVYLNFHGRQVSSSERNILDKSGHATDSLWLFGPQFGLYHDFLSTGPIHVGADFRGSILSRGDAKLNDGMGGLRASLHTHVMPIVPYIQAELGYGAFNYGRREGMTKMLEYEVSGGVDTTIFPQLDWKLIEIGGGGLSTMGGRGGATGTFHISTGLAFRF